MTDHGSSGSAVIYSFESFEGSVTKDISEINSLWSEPEELQPCLQPVKTLDVELLPNVLKQIVNDVSERLQAPPDFIAAPAIVMLGSVVGTACGIKPKRHDDWIVIPNLWGGIIGPPSIKKSPCMAQHLNHWIVWIIEQKNYISNSVMCMQYKKLHMNWKLNKQSKI